MADFRTTATIYCDASYSEGNAGYGFVARIGKRLIAVSQTFRVDVDSSVRAEAMGVLGAIGMARSLMPDLRKVAVRTDCLDVVTGFNTRRGNRSIAEVVEGIKDFGHDNALAIDIGWVKGHRARGAEGMANDVSHRLAGMGRSGEELLLSGDFGIDWRKTLASLDARLVIQPDDALLPFDSVASYLGVCQNTVANLIQHGHLDYSSTGVTLRSVNRVMHALITMRRQPANDSALDMEQMAI